MRLTSKQGLRACTGGARAAATVVPAGCCSTLSTGAKAFHNSSNHTPSCCPANTTQHTPSTRQQRTLAPAAIHCPRPLRPPAGRLLNAAPHPISHPLAPPPPRPCLGWPPRLAAAALPPPPLHPQSSSGWRAWAAQRVPCAAPRLPRPPAWRGCPMLTALQAGWQAWRVQCCLPQGFPCQQQHVRQQSVRSAQPPRGPLASRPLPAARAQPTARAAARLLLLAAAD